MLALAGGLLCYAATSLIGGNGFLAVYVTGMVLGNAALAHQQNIMNFMDGIAWGAQIVMFLLLGLLVFPDRLPGILPYALLITFVAMFIARPFAVLVTLLPFQFFGHKHRFPSGSKPSSAGPVSRARCPSSLPLCCCSTRFRVGSASSTSCLWSWWERRCRD